MCGIAALFTRHRHVLQQLPAMTTAIRHRGPDDEGFVALGGEPVERYGGTDTPTASYAATVPYAPQRPWPDSLPEGTCAVLGHRRLSILDLSPAGHQPMVSETGRYWITYNGEVYNFVELRAELETLGHRFHSRSDTEVILAAYAEWGPGCLSRFQGMWAFVIVDLAERRVFAARDPYGIKPLYLMAVDGGIALASEVKALLTLPGTDRRVNASTLHHYLYNGVCDSPRDTLLAAVTSLPAAHYLTFALDAPSLAEPVPYWRIDPDHRLDVSFAEASDQLRTLFIDSVRLHLRSDVPVGGALSGGIDSSAVVATMRHVAGADLLLHAFTYVADDPALSEERWADIVSSAAGAKGHKIRPATGELTRELEDLVYFQDLPFASSSMYAQHRVFRAAREAGVTVMLDGQGADEALAGYEGYLPSLFQGFLRSGRLIAWIQQFKATKRQPVSPGIVQQVQRDLIPAGIRQLRHHLKGGNASPGWLNHAWFTARGMQAYQPPELSGATPLQAQLLASLNRTSLPSLLRYEDRNSMAHSVESRVPFLLPAITAYCLSLPDAFLISAAGETKSVFRAAMRGIVPDAILDRRDKIGFETPEKGWLLRERAWVEGLLGGDRARSIPALHVPTMLADWQALTEGRIPYDKRFWRWINLTVWADRFDICF